MVDRPLTHYLNSDFDLSLRPRPKQLEQPKLVRQVRELSVQGILGASGDDSVVVRAEVPAEFLEHLELCGACVPTLLFLWAAFFTPLLPLHHIYSKPLCTNFKFCIK